MTDKQIKKPEKKDLERMQKIYSIESIRFAQDEGYNQACDDWEKYLIDAEYVKRDKIRIDKGKLEITFFPYSNF